MALERFTLLCRLGRLRNRLHRGFQVSTHEVRVALVELLLIVSRHGLEDALGRRVLALQLKHPRAEPVAVGAAVDWGAALLPHAPGVLVLPLPT